MQSDPSTADHGPDESPLTVKRTGVNVHLMPHRKDTIPDLLLVVEDDNGQYASNLAGPNDDPANRMPAHSTDTHVSLRLNNNIFTVNAGRAFNLTLDLKHSAEPVRRLIADFSAANPPIPAVEDESELAGFYGEPDTVHRVEPVRWPDTHCQGCGDLFYLGAEPWAVAYHGDHYGLCEECAVRISPTIRSIVANSQ